MGHDGWMKFVTPDTSDVIIAVSAWLDILPHIISSAGLR